MKPKLLATDLDGTLIPLPGQAENLTALEEIRRARETQRFGLIFATGRHDASVFEAIKEYNLPTPDWMICDVGTAILRRDNDRFSDFAPYEQHLRSIAGQSNRTAVETVLADLSGLEPQEAQYQRPFKICYWSAPELVDSLAQECNTRLQQARLPFACVGSVDPFLKIGLLDVLPEGVSKAYALQWLSTHADFHPDEVIYSGDSGNDLAALVSGFRAIVVANASPGLADQVRKALTPRGWADRCYQAKNNATSGVLEGCRHFGLIA